MDRDWAGPCYLIDEKSRTVLNKDMKWDYFNINWMGHKVRRFDSVEWQIFPSVLDAEKYVAAQRLSIFDFSMLLLDGHELEYYQKHGQR